MRQRISPTALVRQHLTHGVAHAATQRGAHCPPRGRPNTNKTNRPRRGRRGNERSQYIATCLRWELQRLGEDPDLGERSLGRAAATATVASAAKVERRLLALLAVAALTLAWLFLGALFLLVLAVS